MNASPKIALVGIVAAIIAFLVYSSAFIVYETEQALITRFGEPKGEPREPGLNWKVPFIDTVIPMERRLLAYDAPKEELILGDQKRLVVDAFARYRIADPLKFYQSVGGSEALLVGRLQSALDASLREVLGRVSLSRILSDERGTLMKDISEAASVKMADFGIAMADVRIKRADLPEQNSQAVFDRMRTEREREAKELRAEGAELAQKIRATADRERRVLLANAQRSAQFLRGDGDAEATKIFGNAFGRDLEFFTFYRTMEAYRNSLTDDNTQLVLSPDSAFFQFFDADRLPSLPEPSAETLAQVKADKAEAEAERKAAEEEAAAAEEAAAEEAAAAEAAAADEASGEGDDATTEDGSTEGTAN